METLDLAERAVLPLLIHPAVWEIIPDTNLSLLPVAKKKHNDFFLTARTNDDEENQSSTDHVLRRSQSEVTGNGPDAHVDVENQSLNDHALADGAWSMLLSNYFWLR
eukprot:Filipodium_phascolosomae@DN1429_c0_g1_i1.p2